MDTKSTRSVINQVAKSEFSRRRVLRTGATGFATALLGAAALRAGVAAQEVTPGADLEEPTGSPVATPAAPSWAEIDTKLAATAPQVALLAAELMNGKVKSIHGLHPDLRLGIASSFKLYILGELVRQVAAKQIAWEDTLKIEERYKSVPGGDMRYAPNGSVFTVRFFAEQMMQHSDNTATDHLFFHLGRENIEKMMTTMDNSDPSRNIPLMSTREFAILKFVYPQSKQDAYLAASVAEKRKILETVIDPMPYSVFNSLPEQTKPIVVDKLQWFGTREDLARAMLHLQTVAEQPGLLPTTEVIALNTQLPFDGEVWPYVGFKGGSEMGLLSGTWLLHRHDQRRFVLTMGFVNPAAALDMSTIVPVMEAARDRLVLAP